MILNGYDFNIVSGHSRTKCKFLNPDVVPSSIVIRQYRTCAIRFNVYLWFWYAIVVIKYHQFEKDQKVIQKSEYAE